jgi:hypothetical protein
MFFRKSLVFNWLARTAVSFGLPPFGFLRVLAKSCEIRKDLRIDFAVFLVSACCKYLILCVLTV